MRTERTSIVPGSIADYLTRNSRLTRRSTTEAWALIEQPKNLRDFFGLVKEMRQRFASSEKLTYGDIFHGCIRGFVIAACRFDESRGLQLVSYARFNAIYEIKQIEKEERPPKGRQFVSIDEPSVRGGLALNEILADPTPISGERIFDIERGLFLSNKLRSAIPRLSPLEQRVINLRYKLEQEDDDGKLTPHQVIGDKMGFSHQRAQQIEDSALGKQSEATPGGDVRR